MIGSIIKTALASVALLAISLVLTTQPPPPPLTRKPINFSRTAYYTVDSYSLYPGRCYRGNIEAEYGVASFHKLLEHIARLPRGTTVFCFSGNFFRGPYTYHDLFQLKRICRTHGIELVIG